jgi:hypothetical protein
MATTLERAGKVGGGGCVAAGGWLGAGGGVAACVVAGSVDVAEGFEDGGGDPPDSAPKTAAPGASRLTAATARKDRCNMRPVTPLFTSGCLRREPIFRLPGFEL